VSERALPDEPRWLTEPTLLAIHAQQIERYGGAHGILDENVVLSRYSGRLLQGSADAIILECKRHNYFTLANT
jgi:hypothetical protein